MPNNKKILVVCSNYYPENTGVAPICTELCESLSQKGLDVTVLTTFPNYPKREIPPEYKRKFFQRENVNGVKIIRTWMLVSKSQKAFVRIAMFVSFMKTCLLGALFSGSADVVLCISSPLPLGFSGWLISKFKRARFVFNVQDLFVEVAKSTKIIKNRFLLNLASKVENFIYRQAKIITVICGSFKENIVSKGIPENKIIVIPNWVDMDLIKPMDKNNNFRKEFNWGNKFVYMHAGNIGLVMGLEVIIESANITAENKNIHYVFLGEGLKKPDLMKMVDKYKLSNVEFIPIRPRSEMPLFLTAADAHFVAMGRDMNYSLPSKLSGIMSAGKPVIGISDNQTDMFKIIKEANCGVCVQPGDAEKLGQEINKMAYNLTVCETYGKNGRVYAEKFFSRKELIQKYYSILINL